jgi:hypothetical protein
MVILRKIARLDRPQRLAYFVVGPQTFRGRPHRAQNPPIAFRSAWVRVAATECRPDAPKLRKIGKI